MIPPRPVPDSDPQPGAGSTPGPHRAGGITVTLTGAYPPITITAADPATLRKNITDLIMRALL